MPNVPFARSANGPVALATALPTFAPEASTEQWRDCVLCSPMVSLKAAPKFHQISSYVANPFRAQLLWGKYLGSVFSVTVLRSADVCLGNRYYQETIIRHVGSKTSTGQIFVSLEVHTHFQFGQWSIPIFEILLKILKSPKCISYKIISYHTQTYIYICRYYDIHNIH